jgi:hypothetical protein
MVKSCVSLFLLLPLTLALVTGCTWSRQRTNITDFHARVSAVVPGETKGADLPAILGSPPNNVIPLGDGGAVLLYTFADSKTNGFNIIIINLNKTNVGVDSAVFIIDSQGIVQEVNVSTNSKDLEWEFWPFGD